MKLAEYRQTAEYQNTLECKVMTIITEHIKMRGYTNREMFEGLGWTHSKYTRLVDGVSVVELNPLKEICTFLGLSLYEIIGQAERLSDIAVANPEPGPKPKPQKKKKPKPKPKPVKQKKVDVLESPKLNGLLIRQHVCIKTPAERLEDLNRMVDASLVDNPNYAVSWHADRCGVLPKFVENRKRWKRLKTDRL